ncbi:LysR family transcriptional regulator [Thiohalophilus sp.]|uniref:LysR family transcriptional regulator n=1 Tax=Thiohalophilus sp. TaxID=3028392 RepID=UPI002ACDFA06|nr:LysR substrate-binding domain-containing protein [Thiohalophilus sp.]MDZ7661701.1 LysR substrate-binding domain-containing protein [Thiohalophilus sp.]
MANASDYTYTPPGAIPDFLIRHATLRQLQVFETIVRLGSFTRAAEELFLTQPTVSMQIKKLTDVIGLPLFEHVGRNVEPTEAGLELYEACRGIFQVMANLEMKISDLKGMRRGRLRLGAITTAKYFAPEVLGEFSALYPGIDVALKVTNRDRIIERMRTNEDDLYIMGQAPTDEMEMVAFPIAPNPLVVMAPRNHPLVGEKNISLERITEEPFILREPGSGIRDAMLRKFDEHKLRPRVKMELGSNEAIKHAIVGGLGLSVLSLHTLTLEGIDGPVAILDVEGFPIMRQWYLVYPRAKELSLVSRAFVDFARELEPQMRERIITMWPEVTQYLTKQDTAASEKATSRKTKRI